MIASTITTTGAYRPIAGCHLTATGRANEIALLFIGMSSAKPGAYALRNLDEFLHLTKFEPALAREVAGDDVDDPSLSWRHHHDLARQKYAFRGLNA